MLQFLLNSLKFAIKILNFSLKLHKSFRISDKFCISKYLEKYIEYVSFKFLFKQDSLSKYKTAIPFNMLFRDELSITQVYNLELRKS